jgi:hypothetical protein
METLTLFRVVVSLLPRPVKIPIKFEKIIIFRTKEFHRDDILTLATTALSHYRNHHVPQGDCGHHQISL